jgi:hypothetical protein
MKCSGLPAVFARMKTWAPSEFTSILVHVAAIEEEAIADTEEFQDSFKGDYKARGVDLSDPRQALEAIMACLGEDKSGTESLKSIMQQLLVPARLSDGHLR